MEQDNLPVVSESIDSNNHADQHDDFVSPCQIDFKSALSEVILSIPKEELQHMQRVGYSTRRLIASVVREPRYRSLSEPYNSFGYCAFYHDIGKAWIPSQILLKKENLTESEFEIIKRHPLYAQKYIGSHLGFFRGGFFLRQMVYNVAVFHHERWDGGGYPYGLQKEGIPLIARITSVCDVYDAITNERPYRKARSHGEACDELRKWAGRQFDPEIVEIFLSQNT